MTTSQSPEVRATLLMILGGQRAAVSPPRLPPTLAVTCIKVINRFSTPVLYCTVLY